MSKTHRVRGVGLFGFVCQWTNCHWDKCLCVMQQVLDSLSEWSSVQAQLNETGNFLIEATDSSTSSTLANELGKLNRRWADFIKRTKFVSTQAVI